jgi:hypothetical protein
MTMRNPFVLFVLLAAACATPYQPKGVRGGYEETQLDRNVFRVSFESNAHVGATTTSDYALLRSSEVALEHGFPFFTIVSSEAGARVVGNKSYTGTEPSAVNTIACFKDRPEPGQAVQVYDAAAVRAALRVKYGISPSTAR